MIEFTEFTVFEGEKRTDSWRGEGAKQLDLWEGAKQRDL